MLMRTVMIVTFLWLSVAPCGRAATITVDTTTDLVQVDGMCSLREAIANANGNTDLSGGDCEAGDNLDDTIVFDLFLRGEVIGLTSGALVVDDAAGNEPLTIIFGVLGASEGSKLTISAGGASRVFEVSSDLTLANLGLEGGVVANDNGGGIFNEAALTLTDVDIRDCQATGSGGPAEGSGGGIFNAPGGTVTIDGGSITSSFADRAGGGIEDASGAPDALDLDGVVIEGNGAGTGPGTTAAPGNGGGIHITGAGGSTIDGSTIANNSAASEGGGLWNGSGTMTLGGGTNVELNSAAGDAADQGGGGIFNDGGTLTISNATISSNFAPGTSGSGGGILNAGGTLDIENTTLSGNASHRAGGGIEVLSGSSTLLTDVTMQGNNSGVAPATPSPGNGGGLHVTGNANVTIDGGLYELNVAAAEGGGLWNGSGRMVIEGATIIDNTASGDDATQGGGGIFQSTGGELEIVDTVIADNIADGLAGSGGGIFVDDGGTLNVFGGTVEGNRANRAGGGIELRSVGTAVLEGVFLGTNKAGVAPADPAPGNGGGVHVSSLDDPSSVSLIECDVAENEAALEGGGLWNAGTPSGVILMSVVRSTLTNNLAHGDAADDGGGGIFNDGGDVVVVSSTLVGNRATGASGSGGGIFGADGGTVIVDDSTIRENTSVRAGGGIENLGELIVVESTLEANDAGSSPGNGGAVHNALAGVFRFDRSTASGNVAVQGGGLWNSGLSEMNVYNSTISGNTASAASPSGGGGIYQQDDLGGTTTLINATVAGNEAPNGDGGGVLNAGSNVVTLRNTLVGTNLASTGADLSGEVAADYSLIGDPVGAVITGADNLVGVDPMIGPLADNTGPTLTHALLEGSPAIDAGDDVTCDGEEIDAVDQRGVARPDGIDRGGASCDIGAVEDAKITPTEPDVVVGGVVPRRARLAQNRPNPFNPTTSIEFGIAESGVVRLAIFSATGRLVSRLVDGHLAPGTYRVRWNGRDDTNRQVATGLYFYRLIAGGDELVRRMSLLQ